MGDAPDDRMRQEIARLTRPGEEFELEDEVVGGIPMRVYRRGPKTLREMFIDSAAFGDRDYSIFEDEVLTFAEHFAVVCGLAEMLRESCRLKPGDRVAIAMRNYPEWGQIFWATQVAGLIAVPMNAWWTSAQLTWAIADSGARLLVADDERTRLVAGEPGLPPIIRVRGKGPAPAGVVEWSDVIDDGTRTAPLPEVSVSPDDVATIFYTSGTTGQPKGVVASQRNQCTNALNVLLQARALAALTPPMSAPTRPGNLLMYPLFHIAGLNGMEAAILAGSRLATVYRWDPEQVVELFARERLTAASGVPTVMGEFTELAIAHPEEMGQVVRVGMGGAPIPGSLIRRIEAGLNGRAYPANGYGLTETTSAVCMNGGPDYFAHPDSVGWLVPGADIKITDPDSGAEVEPGAIGELYFRGPNVVLGYWNQPELTAASFVDGWFRSGDLGYFRDGLVYVVDRLKDVVVRAGENVYSGEVEAAVIAYPGVVEVAVVGIPHPSLGEEVAAVVRSAPGAGTDTDALLAFVAELLPRFAVPSTVVWSPDPLPRNATGKILKAEIRAAVTGSG